MTFRKKVKVTTMKLKNNNQGASLLLVLVVMLFVLTLCSMTLILSNNLSNSRKLRYEKDQIMAYIESSKDSANKLLNNTSFKSSLDAAVTEAMNSSGYSASQDAVAYEFSLDGIKDVNGNLIPVTVKYDASGKYKTKPLITVTAVIDGETYTYSYRFSKTSQPG